MVVVDDDYGSANLHVAISQHFNRDKYDIVRYRAKTYLTREKFNRMNTGYLYHKILKKWDVNLFWFYVYIELFDSKRKINVWFDDTELDANCRSFIGGQQSIRASLEADARTISEFCEEHDCGLKDLLISDGDNEPLIMMLHDDGHVGLNSIGALHTATGFLTKYREVNTQSRVYKYAKYSRLIHRDDVEHFKTIIKRLMP